MASKRNCKVVSVTVSPNVKPYLKETVQQDLTPAKAQALCDKLNDQTAMGDLDPNRIVTYMVEPMAKAPTLPQRVYHDPRDPMFNTYTD